jgi:hypothetical protein
MLKGYAKLLDWTIGDVECKHAHRQAYLARRTSAGFGTVSAASITSDWKSFHVKAAEQLGPLPPLFAPASQKITCYSSCYHAYLKDFCAETKHRGVVHNDGRSEITWKFWDALKAAFQNLSLERQAIYERMAAESKAMANLERADLSSSSVTISAGSQIITTCTDMFGDMTHSMNLVTSAAALHHVPGNVDDANMGSSLGDGYIILIR